MNSISKYLYEQFNDELNEVGLVLSGLGHLAKGAWDVGSFIVPEVVKGGIKLGKASAPYLAQGAIGLGNLLKTGASGALMLGKIGYDDLRDYVNGQDKIVGFIPDKRFGGVRPIRKTDKEQIRNPRMYTPKELRSEQTTYLSETDQEKVKTKLKDSTEKLVNHYAKKENRDKLFSSLKEKYNKHQKWIKSLEKNIDSKILKNLKTKIDNKIKELDPEKEQYTFTQIFKDAVMWIKEAIFPSWKRTKGRMIERFLNRYAVTIITTLVVVINTTMWHLFKSYFGAYGFLLTAVLVAPITEELYKWLTIKLDEKEFGWVWFNIGEFYQYVHMTGSFTLAGIPYMLVRLLCTFFHMINTKVHSDKDLGTESNRFKIASFLHAMWNGPICIIANILKQSVTPILGVLGAGITSVLYFTGIVKLMLSSISKLKSSDSHTTPNTGLEPSPA